MEINNKKLIVLGLISLLLVSALLVTAGFSDLTDSQKQFYWNCLKEDGCLALLKDKLYPDYRSCSLSCYNKAENYDSSAEKHWCQDSDGGVDYFTSGIVTTDLYSEGKEDFCYTWYKGTPKEKTRLIEGICKDNRYIRLQKNCGELGEYKCKEGACVATIDASVAGITWNSAIIQVITNEDALCKYSKKEIGFEEMEGEFEASGKQKHYAFLPNLESSTDYSYYVKCQDKTQYIGKALVDFKTLPAPEGDYIRIETDKDVYESGEEVKIKLVLVHVQDEDVTFSINYFCSFPTSIYNSLDELVHHFPLCPKCNAGFALRTVLANSELILVNYKWDQLKQTDWLTDCSLFDGLVKPGIFRIYVESFISPKMTFPPGYGVDDGEKYIAIID